MNRFLKAAHETRDRAAEARDRLIERAPVEAYNVDRAREAVRAADDAIEAAEASGTEWAAVRAAAYGHAAAVSCQVWLEAAERAIEAEAAAEAAADRLQRAADRAKLDVEAARVARVQATSQAEPMEAAKQAEAAARDASPGRAIRLVAG